MPQCSSDFAIQWKRKRSLYAHNTTMCGSRDRRQPQCMLFCRARITRTHNAPTNRNAHSTYALARACNPLGFDTQLVSTHTHTHSVVLSREFVCVCACYVVMETRRAHLIMGLLPTEKCTRTNKCTRTWRAWRPTHRNQMRAHLQLTTRRRVHFRKEKSEPERCETGALVYL